MGRLLSKRNLLIKSFITSPRFRAAGAATDWAGNPNFNFLDFPTGFNIVSQISSALAFAIKTLHNSPIRLEKRPGKSRRDKEWSEDWLLRGNNL